MKKVKKLKNPFLENKFEIIYRLINSLLAGLLVFFGAFIGGNIDKIALIGALSITAIAFITQFKNYWDTQSGEYKRTLFMFIR